MSKISLRYPRGQWVNMVFPVQQLHFMIWCGMGRDMRGVRICLIVVNFPISHNSTCSICGEMTDDKNQFYDSCWGMSSYYYMLWLLICLLNFNGMVDIIQDHINHCWFEKKKLFLLEKMSTLCRTLIDEVSTLCLLKPWFNDWCLRKVLTANIFNFVSWQHHNMEWL